MDQREVFERRSDMQGEAMHGHPFTDAQAYGGDFLLTDPDAHLMECFTGDKNVLDIPRFTYRDGRRMLRKEQGVLTSPATLC